MKTFDDAIDVIMKELDEPEIWHGNHCRCTEINESRKLGEYCIKLMNPYIKHALAGIILLVDKNDLILIAQIMIELGVAIGQEMEKE